MSSASSATGIKRRWASAIAVVLAVSAAVFGLAAPAHAVVPALGNLVNGATVSFQIATSNPPYELESGSLPGGLTLTPSGLISGVVDTDATSYSFAVHDLDGRAQSFSGTIVHPVIWNTTSVQFTVGTAVDQQLVARWATGFTLTSGSLPAGIDLDASGRLTGTPQLAGAYSFVVAAANTVGSVPQTFSGTVADATPVWTGPTTYYGAPGQPITVPFAASLSVGTAHSIDLANLPGYAMVRLSGTEFVFTMPATGDFSFILNAFNGSALLSTTVAIIVRPAPSWTTTPLPTIPLAAAYSTQLSAQDATSYSVTAGALPTGLTLSADGVLSGTATVFGPYSFTVKASNLYSSVTRTFTGTIAAPLATWTTDDLPVMHVGVAVDVPLVTVGASSIELSSGDLPAGLSLVDGSIVGTPTASGTTDVVFSALNPDGVATTRSLTFIVDEPVLGINLGASAGDLAAGASITVTGSGLASEGGYSLVVHSDPITVASGVTDVNGFLSLAASLPAGIPMGAHVLTFTTTGANGAPITANVWFSVGADGRIIQISTTGPVAEPVAPASATITAMATTGANVVGPAIAALVLLVLGGALLIMRSRRRAS